ncbi:MAG: lipopolysaccharide biosynthesis protein [Candidatus Sulfotelmatobacter sp.]
MATKEITKQERRYVEPELEPELTVEVEDPTLSGKRRVARLALLWQERQLLFRRTGAGFLLSALIAILIPVRFTSTTRLMPPDQAGQGLASMLAVLGKSGDLGSLGSTLLGMKTSGDLFMGVLKSRTVEDDLVSKFDLRKVYRIQRLEDARQELENRTDVTADRKSGILTIKVTDGNRDRAAALGREYVEALNNIVITLNTSSAHKERVFLEERLGQVQQDLEVAEKDFSKFASQNTAIDVKEQGRAMIGAAADLEGQLIAAETQLEGLRQIYTPNNVRIRSLQARIDEYRRQMQKLGGRASPGGEAATASGEEVAPESADLYPSIRQLPILGVTWADLYRRTRVEETVFEALTKQYELAKVEEARETPSVKVLDPANVPERKSYPPRTILTLFGTALVFFFSAVWILARARWQEVDPADPGKMLAQEIFHTIRSGTSGVVSRVWRRWGRRGEQNSRERE